MIGSHVMNTIPNDSNGAMKRYKEKQEKKEAKLKSYGVTLFCLAHFSNDIPKILSYLRANCKSKTTEKVFVCLSKRKSICINNNCFALECYTNESRRLTFQIIGCFVC